MSASGPLQLFIHVEEPSAKAVVEAVLPQLIGSRQVALRVIDHGSKRSLLKALPNRFQGYAKLDGAPLKVLVLVDRDDDDCLALKGQLEAVARQTGLATKTRPDREGRYTIVNRIVVEELEAWFFGDGEALTAAYPKLPKTLSRKAGFRDPDAIAGGTWEALLRVLKRAGYYERMERLPKIEVARRVAAGMAEGRNTSKSFQAFATGIRALVAA